MRIDYNPYGKPLLAEKLCGSRLSFNLSRSGQLSVFAIGWGRELGVDVEHLRSDVLDEGIAERFFSPGEVVALLALPQQLREQGLFACRTRKEAYIKAKGGGLSIPLDQFEVSLAPGESPALKRTSWDPDETSRWRMEELFPAPGYAAALCVEGHG